MGAIDYILLMKPRVIWLLVMASVAGYVVASRGDVDVWRLAALLAIGILSTGGAAAFNMYYERDIDSVMSRTRLRPIPAGRVKPSNGLAFSIALSAASITASYMLLGPTPTMYIILGWVSYAIFYTVLLKRRSWLNIFVGGVAGNAAFLTGWSMAAPVDLEAILYSMAIYLWIPPHIWSLVVTARDDYVRAGVAMLPLMVSERGAYRLVSASNIVSAIYMFMVYAAFVRDPVGTFIMLAAALLSIAYSLRVLARPSPRAFWLMFKASSPLLAVFLALLIASALVG